jgi:hypothetical protein
VADTPWPPDLAADVAAVTCDDFDITDTHIDASLDLVAIAVRP